MEFEIKNVKNKFLYEVEDGKMFTDGMEYLLKVTNKKESNDRVLVVNKGGFIREMDKMTPVRVVNCKLIIED